MLATQTLPGTHHTHIIHNIHSHTALCRRSADPCTCDAAGNTPGHLAAMHGHWLVLTELVKVSGSNSNSY